MKNLASWKGCRGFTLTEILVVLAMVGIFMSAAYGVYIGNQRTALTQQEVSEVQQNLRVGMETLSRDLLNAGCMTMTTTPIRGTSTSVTITGPSDASRTALIVVNPAKPGVKQLVLKTDGTFEDSFGLGNGCLPVSDADDLDVFTSGAETSTDTSRVRIIAPYDGSDPYYSDINSADPALSLLYVSSKNKANNPPYLCVSKLSTALNPANEVIYSVGYRIVRTTAGATFPNTITYAFNPVAGQVTGQLTRTANGTTEVVADRVLSVAFAYQLDGDPVLQANPTADQFTNIRAVRVTLTGQTEQTGLSGQQTKVRQLVATSAVRNWGSKKGRE